MKQCNRCREKKPLNEFQRNAAGKDGLYSLCRTCKTYANRLRTFGLTKEEIEALREKQGGRCAICREVLKSRFEIDHDHSTGEVRGILCWKCNVGLGLLGDNKESIEKAIQYLT